MALLSSKTLIQAHALFLFVLAVYLTRSPEVVTESDLVFMLGEFLNLTKRFIHSIQEASPSLARPQSPFALCGVLLVVDALVDLILVTKVPQINEILAMAQAARVQSPIPVAGAVRTNPFMARLTSLYTEIWTLLSASRFCIFFAVSFFIYQSQPSAWGMDAATAMGNYGSAGAATSGLDQLKNRVVFTYGFMEMMFWLWIFITLREERQEAANRFVEHDR
ncbi:hypothetical protein AbraIFM66951_005354 [Aspergillus brasiliensis]|uniref:Increased loss of mitochondrial DNA protein 1 n=1 Tax=Aspergillus brasiliensis TaxID=319629 RepID=A0A9W5YRB5_9EURO|nr:hypothetical protein AbraCBS73388_006229 [Aspergillus brasiliensis]GKZ28744.1 hypothetical protein AbraIFM66950_000099 [Aspergillus brasiliensis]GKZ43788.1 hypothetical protein AbraIFM66951_005354 [Aspergillus brasiliensis]